MNKKSTVINPNEKSHAFVWAMLVLILIVAAVIGYVVYTNANKEDSNEVVAGWEKVSTSINTDIEGDAIVLTSDNTTDDSTKVELYEDYSCPACAQLAVATDADMLKAVEDGDIVVYIRDLNFKDEGQNDGNSNRVGAASYAIAENESAEVYWNFHAMAMEHQDTIYSSWDLEDLANAARDLGAKDETVEAIKNFDYQDTFLEVADNNTELLRSKINGVSSPNVFINGEHVDPSNIINWVAMAREADGPDADTDKDSESDSDADATTEVTTTETATEETTVTSTASSSN